MVTQDEIHSVDNLNFIFIPESVNPDHTTQKPEDLEKSLFRNLECPVCMEYMTPPIILCHNGHNICNTCRPKLENCPKCRQPFLEARNYALEDLCYKVKYPCKFQEEGCQETFSGKHITEHQAVCHHGIHACLLGRVPEIKCNWKGSFAEFVTHFESQHEDCVCREATFMSPERNASASILLVHNRLFLYYKCFKNGKCYCAVHLFGTSAEARDFKYKVKLSAGNTIEKLSQVALVRSVTEGFEATFRAGHCVRLDDKVIRHYVVEEALQLQVEVSYTNVRELEEPDKRRVRSGGFRPTFFACRPWNLCR
jgi:E3 ubiquitin-protein ligase SIAH1